MNISRFLISSGYDDAVYVTYELARYLGVKVTIDSVSSELVEHPAYPSFLAISDTLNTFGIANVTATIPFDKLTELPAPYLALIKNKFGYDEPVLVRMVRDDRLEILRCEDRKVISVQASAFREEYMEIALIPDKPSADAEINYDRKRAIQSRKTFALTTALGIVPVVVLVYSIVSFKILGVEAVPFVSFAGIALLAGVISCLLSVYENNQNDRLLNHLCASGKSINCQAVLNSPASKIFGLSWSAIGFAYFSGQLLMLLFLTGTAYPIQHVLGITSSLAVPYTVFSIIYQRYFVRQWCSMCLVIQAAILLQFLIAYYFGWINFRAFFIAFFDYPFLGVLMFSAFTIPAVFFYFSIPNLTVRRKLLSYRSELQRLKRDPEVFNALLRHQHPVDVNICSKAISIGKEDVTVKILMVCNPFCMPCAKAHASLSALLRSGVEFQLNIIFLINASESNTSTKAVKHLLAACYDKPALERQQVLHAWYSQEKFDYERFASRFPVSHDTVDLNSRMDAMTEWCEQAKVYATPAIFVNGFRLPKTYLAEDLKYYIMGN